MEKNEFALLTTRRFLPLFITQFLGALNDNLFKNALVILALYRLSGEVGMDGSILVTLAAGIFILPFFLFSATAGQLADRFEKAFLIRVIKAAEVAIMGIGAWGLFLGDIVFLLVVLFLMGAQSAFFGPLKYGILPTHLEEDELIGGNALIEAGTFLAILLGTIAGGLLILVEQGVPIVAVGVVLVAVLGLLASLDIPKALPAAPELRINPNILVETWIMIRRLGDSPAILKSVLGISWFWLIGAMFLAEFPPYAKDVLGGDEQVVTLFLTIFSVGIGMGSLLCNGLLKGEITAKYAPFGALGLSVFTIDLYVASPTSPPQGAELLGALGFIAQAGSWRILFDLLGISVMGGLFIVPLYAIMQRRSPMESRSRIIAANNIMNALFMVVGALGAAGLLTAGFTVPEIFLAGGVGNLGVGIALRRLGGSL